ncbi:helix-turn-helix domain-containing protein [Flectobacillus sp. DC10W]|uniref:Helix-turn-helix domain-containing protein n=1 Tax=Flectobacillus longus TaxID=2984207 RepID=A0ABT6YLJ2_9BACT|nr:helix-turn-helix domain-containing protein [Flectobacillus longus]MDI9864415.1 helix-turn-helix domain-containing protein [Flectobacillus longus]
MMLIAIDKDQLGQMINDAVKKALTELPLQLSESSENDNKLLTVEETAKFLNLSVPTIYSKVSKRELPALKQGKKLHFLKSELFEYLKRGRKKTNEEIAEEASAYTKKKGGKNG